ncbi:MAG: methyltransferase domain-containing protein, partial [Planctomycetes bacterium]|nr:methyltransferase domain-containing protein [Planctomycetota bacterium]
LISIIHVIDHMTDPRTALEAAAFHLRPGGMIMLATHNIDSLLAKLSGESFIAYSIQHICYFTPESLGKMLVRAGLEPVTTKRSLTTYPLRHFAKNGLKEGVFRRSVLSIFETLRLGGLSLSFPFGNFEIFARKGGRS